MRSKRWLIVSSCVVAIALVATTAAFFTTRHSAEAAGNLTYGTLVYGGDTGLSAGSSTKSASGPNDKQPQSVEHNPQVPDANAHSRPLPTQPPSANGFAVTTQAGAGVTSFNGLTHADQRLAGTGIYASTQFSLEPPDQGGCVGRGLVVEPVNNALAIYKSNGTLVAGPTALSQFFNRPPEIIRSNPLVFGDFISDPRCHYDDATQRWFVTELDWSTDPATGAFNPALGDRARELIAVSKTADPTGAWALFSFDNTDDGLNGTPNHTGCPCFGDQPMIGFDRYGMYLTTNEFPLLQNGFDGNQTYAISKYALVSAAAHGQNLPTVVAMDNNDALAPYGGQSYSLLPAMAPPGGDNESSDRFHGVEYFMSALDFTGTDNRMAVWALTNTKSLSTHHPVLTMQLTVINSEAYAGPGNATQKPATSPSQTPFKNAFAPAAPLEQLQSNDDRTNGNTVFSQGLLWTTLNTGILNGTTLTVGTAWFVAEPEFEKGVLHARMVRQGYVSVNNNNLLYGTVGVNDRGVGVVSFTLVGPNYYPSSAYVRISADQGTFGKVHLTGAGVGPDDGFTGYPDATSQGAARWGDYGAVAIDNNGNAWAFSELIPNAPRTLYANWGTHITLIPASDNGD